MAGSEYFLKMFNSEAREGHSSEIVVKEASYESFRLMLRFIYTKDASDVLTADTVLDVYVLSGKYLLSSLQDKCLWYVQSSSNLEAVVGWYTESHRNNALFGVEEMLKGKLIKNFTLLGERHPDLVDDLERQGLLSVIMKGHFGSN